MVVGFVVFFLFFFIRGFVQQRQRQRVNRLQQDIDRMKKEANRRQMTR